MVTRAEYLEANNLSKTKPWEAEGISRRTWERRRNKVDASLTHISLDRKGQTCDSKAGPDAKEESKAWTTPDGAAPLPARPVLRQDHPMSALRYWSPGVSVSTFRREA